MTIRADDLYAAIQEVLAVQVPLLAPTTTQFGVMLLYTPTTALMLNLSGPRWEIGMYDVAGDELRHTRTVATEHGFADYGALIVDVLERCRRTYTSAIGSPEFPEEIKEWFTERLAQVDAALRTPSP